MVIYSEKDKERFLKKVEKTADCWLWKASIGRGPRGGYGRFPKGDKEYRAHRASYEMFKEQIPEKLMVCHSCDNRRCVNPDHLWLGTNSENQKDSANKNRKNSSRFIINNIPKSRKLNANQVKEIRKLRSEGKTQQELADKYKVAHSLIYAIEHRHIWKNC